MRDKIENNIELISLHIPKTAGTSFRFILMEKFRRNEVARLDIYTSGDVMLNEKLFSKKKLKDRIKVIQGHFHYTDVKERLALNQNVDFVTWLRDPVEQVISNYYYLNKIIADRMQEQPNENLMNRMGKTLEEFAKVEENRNVNSKFLKGADLSTFKFVGFQSYFDEDLERFAKIMNWPPTKSFKYNTTGAKPNNISKETIQLIEQYNKVDIELYNEALSSRLNKQ